MASRPMPALILKPPRIILVVVFPIASLILYLVLSVGCINDSLSAISPVIAQSQGAVNLGGQDVQLDLHIGFFGLCFGPAPFNCTGSVAALQTRHESSLASSIPTSKGGGNFALAGLALGLQASFAVLSGIPLLILLIASVFANAVQVFFTTMSSSRERHAQAALWARSLDWAAAAGAATSFAAYQSIVAAAPRLFQTLSGVALDVEVGTTASNLFAAVVAMTLAGAVINTALTAMDTGFDAYLAAKKLSGTMPEGRTAGPQTFMYESRAAYERFP